MKRHEFALFIAPSVLLMLLLMVFPLVTAIYLGFHYITFRNINAPEFIGFGNYLDVLNDRDFWAAVRFTLRYIVITVPSQIVLGLAVALLLDQTKRSRSVYMAGMLLPFIVTPVVGTLIFRGMFERNGIVTYLLNELFNYRFIFTAQTVQTLIVLHGIWYVTPFAIIVFFAGLQTLPKETLEAATIDGAGWWQRVLFVVIPHLRALFVFLGLINVMDAYRVFDSIFVLTQQNPIFGAESIMYYNFRVALSFGQLGRANAIAVLTVIGIFVVLIPFLYLTYQQQMRER